MLMTGRFPLSTGMTNNCQPGLDMELSVDEICIGDVMKAHGYSTGYIGKWHLECPSLNRSKNPVDGATWSWDGWTPPGQRRHGFDFWYAYNTYDQHFTPHYWKDSPEKIEIKQWSVEHETNVAIDFIKNRKKDNPFALFLSWNPPHLPYIAPEKYKSLYADRDFPPRLNVKGDINEERFLGYFAAVTSCDDNFGRLLKSLDEQGIADNTIVVFTSDHGEMLQSHGRWSKNIWYEESIGIPFLIRWPHRISAGREEMLFASYDFMPTLLGLMELPIPETVETTDYSGVLLGKENTGPSSVFLTKYPNTGQLLAVGQEPSPWVKEGAELRSRGIDWRKIGYRGLRTNRYTYAVNRPNDGKTVERFLYDNEHDPYQLNPVKAVEADENPHMRELEKELQEWLTKLGDPFPL